MKFGNPATTMFEGFHGPIVSTSHKLALKSREDGRRLDTPGVLAWRKPWTEILSSASYENQRGPQL